MNLEKYTLKYDKNFISEAVLNTANKLNKFVKEKELEKNKIYVVPVLRSAVFFACDLMRLLDFNFELEFVRASSYTNNKQSSSVSIDAMDNKFKDCVIILIDDICDTGKTLATLVSHLKNKIGVKDVISVVSIGRKNSLKTFSPDFVCIEDDSDDWLLGYGMDDNEFGRNLTQIYTLKEKN